MQRMIVSLCVTTLYILPHQREVVKYCGDAGFCGRDSAMKVTPFQQRVYDAILTIPKGKVATYQAVAARIGCGSARAVGQALRRNPFAPRVPCHRVIASDLTMGGFEGEVGGAAIRKKLHLLNREGVRFEGGKLAESSRLFTFPGRRRQGS